MNIYKFLSEMFEVDNLNSKDILADFDQWDSLSALMLASHLRVEGVVLYTDEIAMAKTIGDLDDLIKAKSK